MLILEFKAKGNKKQYSQIDEAIRTAQFIQNKCIRYWMDNKGASKFDLNKYCAVLANEFPFAKELGSQARQSSAERAWFAISRFFDNCKKGKPGKKGFPTFKKNCRSVEYKTAGWKLSDDRKSITFTDGKAIGRLKLKGSRDLGFYDPSLIKRVRLVKRADGIYVQFAIKIDRQETLEPTGEVLGIDVGLQDFYTDSNGAKEENPRFLRKAEKKLKRLQRLKSRKVKGSKNRLKAIKALGKAHLKVSRQRKDHAVKLARCVIRSNDLVVIEDLQVSNMVKNHCLAKSISDASWYQFRVWLEYFSKVFGKVTLAVAPNYTSQECSDCGTIVKKSLSTRTHVCKCGCELDRDHNAAINILSKGLNTLGHREIYASGDQTSTLVELVLAKAS